MIQGHKIKNRTSMNAVRIYSSAGNHVLRPLGDDNARVAIFMDILKATGKEYLLVQKK